MVQTTLRFNGSLDKPLFDPIMDEKKLEELVDWMKIDTRTGSGFRWNQDMTPKQRQMVYRFCVDRSNHSSMNKMIKYLHAGQISFQDRGNPFERILDPIEQIEPFSEKIRNYFLDIFVPKIKCREWNRKNESWRKILL